MSATQVQIGTWDVQACDTGRLPSHRSGLNAILILEENQHEQATQALMHFKTLTGLILSTLAVSVAAGPQAAPIALAKGLVARIVDFQKNAAELTGGSSDELTPVGTNAIQSGELNQEWAIAEDQSGDGEYTIRNANSGTYLSYTTAYTGAEPLNAQLCGSQYNPVVWTLYQTSTGPDYYNIVISQSSGPALAITSWSKDSSSVGNGTPLTLQPYNPGLPAAEQEFSCPRRSDSAEDAWNIVVVAASVVAGGALASQPAVTIRNGTVLGVDLPQNGQQLFLGIPYAQPPLGDLRLRRPQSINATFPGGHVDATAYGPHCLSAYTTGFDDNSGFNSSEDCLTLNIVRPYAATEKNRVPVLIWIHGGGLTESGSGDYRFNGTYLVEASVANGHPMVFVSMNYRLAAFGFMGGAELEADGSLNLGMHDQRLAMQWVQENIARFGGDPGRVTVQGERCVVLFSGFFICLTALQRMRVSVPVPLSRLKKLLSQAGGIVLVTHLTAYRGRNDHLFQQAIIQSGVVPGQYPPASIPAAQVTFDSLLNGTSCAGTYGGTAEEKLACVQALPVDEFRKAAVGPVGVLFDGEMVDMISSFEAFRAGMWVKVPLLVGSNTDEGCTFFAPGANTTAEASAAMAALTTNTT
uniref:Carboxylesterase type B domain-containing protein n=1 Tax=Mycena chlorophos TaxID=658473 RepID=A0ABQ0KWV3_MYCCL|nr:predicted protein [Mycena chlorophos]